MMSQTAEPEQVTDPAIIAARNSEPLPPLEDIPGISGRIVGGSGGRIELTPRSTPPEDRGETPTEPKLEIPDMPVTPDMFGKRVDNPVLQISEPPKAEEQPPAVAEPTLSLDILKEMKPPKAPEPAVPLEPMRPAEAPEAAMPATTSNPAMPPGMTETPAPVARPNPAMPPSMTETPAPVARPNPAMPPSMPEPEAPEPEEPQTPTQKDGDFPQGEFLKMFPNARPD